MSSIPSAAARSRPIQCESFSDSASAGRQTILQAKLGSGLASQTTRCQVLFETSPRPQTNEREASVETKTAGRRVPLADVRSPAAKSAALIIARPPSRSGSAGLRSAAARMQTRPPRRDLLLNVERTTYAAVSVQHRGLFGQTRGRKLRQHADVRQSLSR